MFSTKRAGFLALPLVVAAFGCSGGAPMSPHNASETMAPAPPPDVVGGGSPTAESAPSQPAPMMNADKSASVSGTAPREHTAQQEPQNRPGLGTEWGETRSSHISSAPFSRADSSPFALASLFYNDEQGSRAMASLAGFKQSSTGSVEVGNGVATMSLKDTDTGRFLTGFEAASKDYVVGMEGQRYTIVVESHVPSRLEVVVSVDGLDVLDGKNASLTKRGYIIEPNQTIEIDGFRQSMDEVAAFKFGSVRNSYAELKHGDTRNVGVIGIALFNEVGTNPNTWNRGEIQRRMDANPFPGSFATPPR